MHGYQCGMIWGAALAAGAQAYRMFGKGPQAEARTIIAANRIVESFRTRNKHINCSEITGIDLSAPNPRAIARFILKSGLTGSCFGMAARYAPAAFDEIKASFSADDDKALPAPVSCSVVLARRMGASDVHTAMVAGFAGGVGLSGGAFGALGAVIWILGMNILKDGGTLGLTVPGIDETIERFKNSTNNEFECSKIVGRKFENVTDHASYLRSGGCSALIEILAAQYSKPKGNAS